MNHARHGFQLCHKQNQSLQVCQTRVRPGLISVPSATLFVGHPVALDWIIPCCLEFPSKQGLTHTHTHMEVSGHSQLAVFIFYLSLFSLSSFVNYSTETMEPVRPFISLHPTICVNAKKATTFFGYREELKAIDYMCLYIYIYTYMCISRRCNFLQVQNYAFITPSTYSASSR